MNSVLYLTVPSRQQYLLLLDTLNLRWSQTYQVWPEFKVLKVRRGFQIRVAHIRQCWEFCLRIDPYPHGR